MHKAKVVGSIPILGRRLLIFLIFSYFIRLNLNNHKELDSNGVKMSSIGLLYLPAMYSPNFVNG
jgi:hypothetical protein